MIKLLHFTISGEISDDMLLALTSYLLLSPLSRTFRRVRIDFSSSSPAAAARSSLNMKVFGVNPIHCYFIKVTSVPLYYLTAVRYEVERCCYASSLMA